MPTLRGKKIKARSYQHYFGTQELAPQIPEIELQALVKQLPDPEAADRIIQGHMRLACQIAGRYLWGYKHKTEDIVSAAMEGVVRAVNDFPNRQRDDNITKYIVSKVHQVISDYIRNDHLIHVPHMHVAEQRRKNPSSDQASLYLTPVPLDHDIEIRDPRAQVTVLDYPDLYDRMKLTSRERKVCECLLDGMTLKEMADIFGVSYVAVHHWINKIREKAHACLCTR